MRGRVADEGGRASGGGQAGGGEGRRASGGGQAGEWAGGRAGACVRDYCFAMKSLTLGIVRASASSALAYSRL
ncbi:MAG: hypothetical protein LBQ31_10495 [Bacteroidales bacterium]|nr:hypothetical protein [Bacteroidales bacterium]